MGGSDGRRCVDHMLDEQERLYQRFVDDYDITVVEYLGCLEAMKHRCLELMDEEE